MGDQISDQRVGRVTRGIFPVTYAYWGGAWHGDRPMTSISDIKDGTSNTAMMSERLCQMAADGKYRAQSPAACVADEVKHTVAAAHPGSTFRTSPIVCYNVSDGTHFKAGEMLHAYGGQNWHDGEVEICGFNTVLPPNAPSCSEGGGWGDSSHVIIPPSSDHPGGANVLMADGSVSFVSETIDTGDLTVAQPNTGYSRYGVWGAMGSKDGGEVQ